MRLNHSISSSAHPRGLSLAACSDHIALQLQNAIRLVVASRQPLVFSAAVDTSDGQTATWRWHIKPVFRQGVVVAVDLTRSSRPLATHEAVFGPSLN